MPGRVRRRLRYGNQKPASPMAKFVLRKTYVVQAPAAGTAPQNGALMQINVSSPFKPMTAVSGTWIEQNTVSEPFGLDSDIYSQYRHIVVLGAKVQCIVRDNPDIPASGTFDKVQGTVSLTRTTDTGIVVPTSLNSDLQQTYGTKQRNFSMALAGTSNLTKNAYVKNGYSARKTFQTSATSNNELWINNVSGSSNIPADNTYMMCMVRPTMDTLSGSTLKDFNVDFKITYVIKFFEPTAPDNIPMPIKKRPHPPKYPKPPGVRRAYFSEAAAGIAATAAAAAYKAYSGAGVAAMPATPFGVPGRAWRGYRR